MFGLELLGACKLEIASEKDKNAVKTDMQWLSQWRKSMSKMKTFIKTVSVIIQLYFLLTSLCIRMCPFQRIYHTFVEFKAVRMKVC